jgi:SAM-dependent methyltransferase
VQTTALEPLGPEFDFFTDIQNRAVEFCRQGGIPLTLMRMTGEELDVREQFDVAFTINALEHMRDPLRTLDNMYGSLRPGGRLLAHCPNYTVPFDSHFNVLLVTRSKRLNAWLYRSKIDAYPSVWEELNFIRYVDIRRHLGRRGWEYSFDKSIMPSSIARIQNDAAFAQRMPLPLRLLAGAVRYFGLVHALNLMPPRLQTPMEVVARKPSEPVDGRCANVPV